MRGVVKGMAFVIPFWGAVIYVLAVKGWMGHFFAAIGALCLLLVMGTVLGVVIEWRNNARQNQQDPHRNRIADGDDVHPDDADSGSDL